MAPSALPDEVVLPALLRAARGVYADEIRRRLAAAGFEDMPRNGSFVLGGLVNHGGSPSDFIHRLGITKQAAGQLIDTLVLRGYLERQTNPDDRRRMVISVTERGTAAAGVVRTGVEAIDAELKRRLSPAELQGLRTGLATLSAMGDEAHDR